MLVTKSGGYSLKCPSCGSVAYFTCDYKGHLGKITCSTCKHKATSCKFQDQKLKKGKN